MMFCACECLCMAYPHESGEVMARILYYWVEPHVATLHRESIALSDYDYIARNDIFLAGARNRLSP